MTKKQFVKIIGDLKKYDKALDKLFNVNKSFGMGICENYDLKDLVIETLEIAMNVKPNLVYGSDISWFIYETEYGKKCPYIFIGKKTYTIDTAEKLYNFIRKNGESYETNVD